jgi:hypothetical protein
VKTKEKIMLGGGEEDSRRNEFFFNLYRMLSGRGKWLSRHACKRQLTAKRVPCMSRRVLSAKCVPCVSRHGADTDVRNLILRVF